MLGKLIIVKQCPHFFHIHTYNNDNEKFEVGQVISTTKYNREGTFLNYPKRFREDEFEKVRKESFNDFPSRFSCLFLSDDIQKAGYWAEKLRNRTGNIQCVEIELLSGKYVCLDEQIYNIENFTTKEMQEEAYSYWNGDEMERNSIIAILFEGEFRIYKEVCL